MHFTIKQARQFVDKTQQEMADALEVCRTTYRKYELNPDSIPIWCAKRIVEITGIPFDNIFFGRISTECRDAANRKESTNE